MLVDSHCHLDFPDFSAELDGVVSRARAAGMDSAAAEVRRSSPSGGSPARRRWGQSGAIRIKRCAQREPANRRTPESEALRGEVEEAVTSAIDELPDTQREILLLVHYEQLPLAEIAEIMHLEITAVKSRLQRARATLRETLAAYAPQTERIV